MADTRSITITLKATGGGNNASSEANTSNQTNPSNVQNENDNDSTAKAVAFFAVKKGVEAIVSEGLAWAEYEWNKELVLADDYVGQREKRIALQQINRVASGTSNIATATASGAMVGGWIGALIGFALGTGVEIAKTVRSNIQGQEQEDIALRQMDAQLQFTRSRAGWSTRAASIGEDL